jgi:hypothetical protein
MKMLSRLTPLCPGFLGAFRVSNVARHFAIKFHETIKDSLLLLIGYFVFTQPLRLV